MKQEKGKSPFLLSLMAPKFADSSEGQGLQKTEKE
jgi:hypothetical protein